MTENAASSVPEPLAKRRTYRRLAFGVLMAGVVAGLVLRGAGYPLAGEGVYWLGIVGAIAAYVVSPVPLLDERDTRMEERASRLALTAGAPLFVLGASALRTLNVLDVWTAPAFVWGMGYGFLAVYVLFAAAFAVVWYRT
ncbi:DUF2178 domain-containing protein [Halosegnis marinus]|uniref:DUF2178 domain-containing protein n=1 Tax=Halosegnis marinus TaxID=3034023 RepID=A0ABD5ZMV3_9EURY|nr:DUF2178 domain-containing protein [Halosegnis sp. DT85]